MMKKAIVLLTALAVAAGFTGCQRESSFQSQEPQVASGEKVNTQLVLNVATGTEQTKQTSAAVQATSSDVFRGMDEAKLLTYTQKTGDELNDGLILKDPASASQAPLELKHLFSINEATRRVVSVKLPEETNTLVFYGKGPNTIEDPDVYNAYGKLGAYSVAQSVGDSHFDLGARLTDNVGFTAMKKLLAGILTDVMNTSLNGEAFELDDISVSADDYNNIPDQVCKSWADYGGITDGKSIVEPNTVWYVWEENLANIYVKMTGIDYTTSSKETELRAGSGEAILSMVKEMWVVIKSITTKTATTKAEAVAKKLARAIDEKLSNKYFTYTETTGENPQTVVAFKGYDELPLSQLGLTETEITALNAHVPAKFPSDFNLLTGVAYLTFDVDHKTFDYPEVLNTMGMGGLSTDGFKATDFYYPAELLYFGNSPVQTSKVEYSASDYPESPSEWRDYTWTTNWPYSHVEKDSRSVAMVNNIRYGVAMLETYVAFTDQVSQAKKIKTNNPELPGQVMSVGAGTFELTGVIVGGQRTSVGWNFLPTSGSGQGFVYDKFNAISVPLSGNSVANYTVVFDNYAESDTQNTVHVALEFKNNGDSFYGRKEKVVRTGDYFYLIGELDPASTSAGIANIEWPEKGNIIPPYIIDEGTGKIVSTKKPRIFIQDFKTTVIFKIGPNSLKYAYLTVPDLRSTSMTLGLSVDIVWRQGLNYGEVIVGGN